MRSTVGSTCGSGNSPRIYEAGNYKINVKDNPLVKEREGSGGKALNDIFEKNMRRQASEEDRGKEIGDLLDHQDTIADEQEQRITEGSFTRKQLEVNTDADIRSMLDARFSLTGSRAWGTESYCSDYDYVTTPDMYNNLLKKFKDKNVVYHDHPVYKALYVADMYGMYNVICVSYFDLRCWQFATKAMKGLVNEGALPDEVFIDKDKVYYMFENLRNMYRVVGAK